MNAISQRRRSATSSPAIFAPPESSSSLASTSVAAAGESLAEACRAASVDPTGSLERSTRCRRPPAAPRTWRAWPVERLIDHIVTTHHAYVRGAMPTDRELPRDGSRRRTARGIPSWRASRACFDGRQPRVGAAHDERRAGALSVCRRACHARRRACGRTPSPFGTVENPIRMMEREHQRGRRRPARHPRVDRRIFGTRSTAAPPTRSAWRNWPGSKATCTVMSISKTTSCSQRRSPSSRHRDCDRRRHRWESTEVRQRPFVSRRKYGGSRSRHR